MAGSRGQVEGGKASRVRYRSMLRRHMEDIESRETRVGSHDGVQMVLMDMQTAGYPRGGKEMGENLAYLVDS